MKFSTTCFLAAIALATTADAAFTSQNQRVNNIVLDATVVRPTTGGSNNYFDSLSDTGDLERTIQDAYQTWRSQYDKPYDQRRYMNFRDNYMAMNQANQEQARRMGRVAKQPVLNQFGDLSSEEYAMRSKEELSSTGTDTAMPFFVTPAKRAAHTSSDIHTTALRNHALLIKERTLQNQINDISVGNPVLQVQQQVHETVKQIQDSMREQQTAVLLKQIQANTHAQVAELKHKMWYHGEVDLQLAHLLHVRKNVHRQVSTIKSKMQTAETLLAGLRKYQAGVNSVVSKLQATMAKADSVQNNDANRLLAQMKASQSQVRNIVSNMQATMNAAAPTTDSDASKLLANMRSNQLKVQGIVKQLNDKIELSDEPSVVEVKEVLHQMKQQMEEATPEEEEEFELDPVLKQMAWEPELQVKNHLKAEATPQTPPAAQQQQQQQQQQQAPHQPQALHERTAPLAPVVNRLQRKVNLNDRQQWNVPAAVAVAKDSFKTWELRKPTIERIKVVMESSSVGQAVDTDINLWTGVDALPYQLRYFSPNGKSLSAVLETPRGPNTVAVRNYAETVAVHVEPNPADHAETVPVRLGKGPASIRQQNEESFAFAPNVASVQIMIENPSRQPINAKIELIGKDGQSQILEVFSEDGMERPFFCILDAAAEIKITNQGSSGSIKAVAEPYVLRPTSAEMRTLQSHEGYAARTPSRPKEYMQQPSLQLQPDQYKYSSMGATAGRW